MGRDDVKGPERGEMMRKALSGVRRSEGPEWGEKMRKASSGARRCERP